MRARLLGAAILALAAPASAPAQTAPTGGVACASGALLLCSAIAPGFNRWIFTPLGVAPPDAEMAAQICQADKGLRVASSRRRPIETGPLTRIVVLDVACAPLAAAVRPAARPASRPAPVERPVLAGSPQDFTPQVERRDAVEAEVRRATRSERRADREDARARRREAERGAREARERRRERAAERSERQRSAAASPQAVPRSVEPSSPPRPAPVASEPKPAPSVVAEPRPAQRPATPSKPRRTPKDDPSISYEHF